MNKAIIPLIALLLTGCVGTGPNTQRGAVTGGALGAITGAVIGNNTHAGVGQGALIGGLVGALAGGTLGNAQDHEQGTIYTETMPQVPVPYAETIPMMPAPDCVWVPGYWDWRYDTYFWVPGVWVYDRVRFERPHWVRHESGRGYRWHPGTWHSK